MPRTLLIPLRSRSSSDPSRHRFARVRTSLARHLPEVSIAGTDQAGSLSLISQYSESVFSVGANPEIPESLKHLNNVTFLNGRSPDILAHLLRELDSAGLPPEFILIDGEAEGISKHIAGLIAYIPKKPLFVMLQHSFNPECRERMIAGGWERSPYVHLFEIDFVPGRILEQDGQMPGGFALAFLQPTPRESDLVIGQACRTTFDAVLQNRAARN